MSPELFDVIVLGATGFTGKWVVEYFNTVAGDRKWAIAGRNLKSLEDIAVGTTAECIQVDISSTDTLERAVKQTNTGPFRLLGEPVVKACVENGVDYLDISGEPEFIEAMELRYNEAAQKSGSIVISACGFDSIPSEIGLNYLRDNFNGELHQAEAFFTMNPAAGYCGHATTWDCAVLGFANQDGLKALRRLNKPRKIEYKGQRAEIRRFGSTISDVIPDLTGKRTIPFPGSDYSIVRRSQNLFDACGNNIPVRFSIYAVVGSITSIIGISFTGFFLTLLSKFTCGQSLLMRFPEFFTFGSFSRAGPPKESIGKSSFNITFVGNGIDSDGNTKTMTSRVSGPEPGYDATSKILVSSALTLLADREKIAENLKSPGGVSTTAFAFYKTSIIEKLTTAGLQFEMF